MAKSRTDIWVADGGGPLARECGFGDAASSAELLHADG